ncbi:MAG TPA: phasin family protein [Usitatibacter sp.]|jgi:phasin family protein|nr:phasin family protein [Usitatibacter sp.]
MLKIDTFTAANDAAIEQFTQLAQLSLANAQRFAELGLGAARESVEQVAAHAQSLAGAKDVHEVIALNSAALEPVMKRAYSYSRTAYETAAETNAEVKKAFEKQAAEFNRAAAAALEEAFKYAPTGSEAIVENMKSAVAAAQAAYGNLASLNKRVYDTVEKSVQDGAGAVKSAAKSRSRKR